MNADTRPASTDERDDSDSEERVAKVLTLFRQVGRLDAKIDFEPSFKAVAGQVLHNRFLLGFDRREAGERRDQIIASMCEKIGMPSALLAAFRDGLPDANHVYFGVEKDARTLLFKAYLEFRDQVAESIADAAGDGGSLRLFTGFKWDSSLPDRQIVSHYLWYPSLPLSGIFERLRAVMDAEDHHAGLLEFAEAIATRASQRIAPGDIQYLEVAEAGNPRRSFDLNIYKSALTLEDVFPELLRALQCLNAPFSQLEPGYRRIKSERFGHLAAGVDRENNDFFTIYYGVKDFHSSQLVAAKVAPEARPPRPRW